MTENKGEETKDEKAEEQKTPEPPTAEEIKAAVEAGEGRVSELAGLALSIGVLLTADVMGAFKAVFEAEGLGRKDQCPCGSGHSFKDCCRSIWRMIGTQQQTLRREAETGKQETKEEFVKRLKEEVDWMVTVGMHPGNGRIMFDYPEDEDPMPQSVLVELLFKGWMEAFLRMSAMNTRNEVLGMLQQVSQQQGKGRGRRPGNQRRF